MNLNDNAEYEILEVPQPDTVKSAFIDEILSFSKETFADVTKAIYSAPAFIETVKASHPEKVLAASLTDEQKKQLAEGSLRLMRRKSDGSILATLVDNATSHIYKQVPLEELNLAPEAMQSMTNLTTQLQLAQIIEKIECVQKIVSDVRKGLENDRLATAYSCKQKFFQIRAMRNKTLKTTALLQLAMDAEDSRNLLMLSLKSNVDFLKNQPESFFGKLLSGSKTEEIDSRIDEIRDGLYAINTVSMAQIVAYQMLGEPRAARFAMAYYANYIKSVFVDSADVANRLNQLDESTECYWTTLILSIVDDVTALCDNEYEKIALGA